MPFAFSSNHRTFTDLVTGGSKIHVVAPGLDEPRTHALVEAARRRAEVRVVLDPAEETERHGLGSLGAISLLRDAGVEVRQLSGIAIGFVVADGEGYLHFARSRMFAADGKSLDAIRVDALTSARLIRAFFPPRDEADATAAEERIESAIQDSESIRRSVEADEPVHGVAPVDEGKLIEAQESLAENPPRDPDRFREIQVYTRRLQFAEITIRGGNLSSQSVSFPKDLPLGISHELQQQLDTKLRVFEKGTKSLQSYRTFLKDAKALREGHTTLIRSRDKRVFRTEDRQALKDAIAKLNARIPQVRSEIAMHVMAELDRTRGELEREVARLLTEDPPGELGLFQANPELFQEMATDRARRIVAGIDFPDPVALLSRLEIDDHYYDLTWEDFDDDEFIRELYEEGVIDQQSADELRDLRTAFEDDSP